MQNLNLERFWRANWNSERRIANESSNEDAVT
jgi:hypothetical protein